MQDCKRKIVTPSVKAQARALMSGVGATALCNVPLPKCEEIESAAILWLRSAGANEV